MDDLEFLQPFFLGPSGENDKILEDLIVEFVRDHTYWRRNFHPEDGHRITAAAQHRPDFLASQAKTRQALLRLSADLKRAVPFFHPRYVGHMSSDLLIPGLVARILTTLYNPNNVSDEAAGVTLGEELKVGRELAEMFGFAVDGEAEPCAWGHLTSGGTVANYEALWNFRSVKFYGVALQAGVLEAGITVGDVGSLDRPLAAYTKWQLMNLSIDETIALRRQVAQVARGLGPDSFARFSSAVRRERIESLGTAGFFLKHRALNPPRLLVASSAHYSWEKGMKVLGLGTAQLIKVAVDDHMRMDPYHLEDCLGESFEAQIPVLGVVGILGTTEFGTVDPIHEIIAARRRWKAKGNDFYVHIDAAWGGYLMSVFRSPEGDLHSQESLSKEFKYFPGSLVYKSFAAVKEADSVTIDPHKLGFLPYAAGAFVARNREIVDFIAQSAAYVFDLGDVEEEIPREQKLRNLGQYILEGSKAGAAAASVSVAHDVLPLNSEGLGRILKHTIRTCEHFFDTAQVVAGRLSDRVRMVVPFEPDSNLVCIALNPVGNRDLAVMNRFSRDVFAYMKVDATKPVQNARFIGSYTSLQKDALAEEQGGRILEELGVDPQTFRLVPADPSRDADHLFILRHTLMNPFIMDGPDGRSYVELYWDFLEEVVDRVLAGEKK